MAPTLTDRIVSRIRERGPMTVAEFMELALYDHDHGYYASAPRRSGRAGDFFTSVDVGSLFGEMVARQLAEMWDLLRESGAGRFELVEAGAGDGQLTRDVLDAAARNHRDLYDQMRVILVERSAAARRQQSDVLAAHTDRVSASLEALPSGVTGVIVANELLDALPVHSVTMTEGGLREVYVQERNGELGEIAGPISRRQIEDHLAQVGAALDLGARAEVGLDATEWIRRAAKALTHGFLLLFDYGHEAQELYSATHASGTLVAYRHHTASAAHWLESPGNRDVTAEVDLTSIRHAAEAAGLTAVGCVDQTYFLMALGIAEHLDGGTDRKALKRRLAARTLLLPGGLGSTIKVLAFARNLPRPHLRGFCGGRIT
jgi:SAM-dependent MidA family methyltransferase